MSIKTVLSNNNPHERDKGINFYDTYKIDYGKYETD